MNATIALRIVRIALYVYGGNDYDKKRTDRTGGSFNQR